MTWGRSTSLAAGSCAALALAASLKLGATAQSPPHSSDPLPALLAEVHALRLTMEQSAAVAPRVQLTLARLNIEEQRVTHLANELDQVRRSLEAAMLNLKKSSDDLPDVDRQLQLETDPVRRKGLEAGLSDLKRQLTAQAAQEQQLRARENDAAAALAAEQARWADLNARLDELERLLAPMR